MKRKQSTAAIWLSSSGSLPNHCDAALVLINRTTWPSSRPETRIFSNYLLFPGPCGRSWFHHLSRRHYWRTASFSFLVLVMLTLEESVRALSVQYQWAVVDDRGEESNSSFSGHNESAIHFGFKKRAQYFIIVIRESALACDCMGTIV